jgi:hypothetical protein
MVNMSAAIALASYCVILRRRGSPERAEEIAFRFRNLASEMEQHPRVRVEAWRGRRIGFPAGLPDT